MSAIAIGIKRKIRKNSKISVFEWNREGAWEDKFSGSAKELMEKLEAFALGLEMGKNFKN